MKKVKDIPMQVVWDAKILWQSICRKNFEKYGDEGSCVLGSGIAVYAMPLKGKTEKKIMLIDSNIASCCQGSLNWERGIEEVLELFKKNGIDAFYESGHMD